MAAHTAYATRACSIRARAAAKPSGLRRIRTVFELAAGYAFGIARNHPFVDGNKRTAFVACALFLRVNGQILDAPRGPGSHRVPAARGGRDRRGGAGGLAAAELGAAGCHLSRARAGRVTRFVQPPMSIRPSTFASISPRLRIAAMTTAASRGPSRSSIMRGASASMA